MNANKSPERLPIHDVVELSGYMLADFVPYDSAAWQNLYAQYLASNLPGSLTLATVTLVCILLLWRHGNTSRAGLNAAAFFALAACWAWLGLVFHNQWHQQLNWAAYYWVYAFLLQALLLLCTGFYMAIGNAPTLDGSASIDSTQGFGAGATVLLLLPWLAPPLAGGLIGSRAPSAWEFVGAAPDPTAWLSILFILLTLAGSRHQRIRVIGWLLLVIPVLSLAASAAPAWVTGATELLVVQALAALSIAIAAIGARKQC